MGTVTGVGRARLSEGPVLWGCFLMVGQGSKQKQNGMPKSRLPL